jgi:hypothetical protein
MAAQWLQPVATGRKSKAPEARGNKRKPLPWVPPVAAINAW